MKTIFALCPVLCFIAIAATRHHFDAFNNSIILALHNTSTPSLTDLAIALAVVGDTSGMVILSAIACGALVLIRRSLEAARLAVIMIVGSSLNAYLKTVFQDSRPDLFISPWPAGGYSFPSGHAQSAMALYGTIALLLRRRGATITCAIMILATGWCRVYLGVHRSTDILAGYCLAASVIGLVFAVRRTSACTAPAACL